MGNESQPSIVALGQRIEKKALPEILFGYASLSTDKNDASVIYFFLVSDLKY